MLAKRSFWWHKIEVAPGVFTPGHKDTITELKERISLPEDLTGKTVLDIGAAEGFYSFECERRGATVTAVDRVDGEESGFSIVKRIINAKAEHKRCSVYNLSVEEIGQFDLVLCLGVIYHLRYPLLALDVLHSICKSDMILETQICDKYYLNTKGDICNLGDLGPELTKTPMAQFYPGRELNNDITNWWAPNLVGLLSMLETSGFTSEVHFCDGIRAILHCKKVTPTSEGAQWTRLEVSSVNIPVNGYHRKG